MPIARRPPSTGFRFDGVSLRIRNRCRRLALLLALAGSLPLAHAGYMQAKAGLAQILLQHAWRQRLQDGTVAKPWPWADTTPVARLRVERLGVDEIILSGNSGRTLAFAPGWAESTAVPGEPGTSVISAHRDTHFSFLRHLRVSDLIDLRGPRLSRRYRVASMRVVDSRQGEVELAVDQEALVLVTCFPFDAVDAGGPLRLVVTAVPAAMQADQPSVAGSLMSPASSGPP